jgi:hypothetical protein
MVAKEHGISPRYARHCLDETRAGFRRLRAMVCESTEESALGAIDYWPDDEKLKAARRVRSEPELLARFIAMQPYRTALKREEVATQFLEFVIEESEKVTREVWSEALSRLTPMARRPQSSVPRSRLR